VKVNVTNDYTLFYAFGVDLKQTRTTHMPTQTFASVIYRCRQITSGIGIGTRYRYRSRQKYRYRKYRWIVVSVSP